MKHMDISGEIDDYRIRVGVVDGIFCYQPFRNGRLEKAIQLFESFGDDDTNERYLRENFDVIKDKNGLIIRLKKVII